MHPALDQKYREHDVFGKITFYAEFYKDLSYHIMSWMSSGTESIFNLDTYVYSSMQGTLESIHDTLSKARISDAYALLRKYYNSTIINVYTNLYLEDEQSVENFIVEKINNWLNGRERLPEYRIMSQYILNSPKLESIRTLIIQNGQYKDIRERCNDHTHYNYYRVNVLIEIIIGQREHGMFGIEMFRYQACIFCFIKKLLIAKANREGMQVRFMPARQSRHSSHHDQR